MTKRALSLLLALVMALSLCVPAFAAEAPAAEEPTEAVEAGTEAEASAGAEEEEEPAVDAPAEAAEDVPMLVALGIINKDDHDALERAVEEARPLLAKVQAGQLRAKTANPVLTSVDIAKYADDPEEIDPFQNMTSNGSGSFEDALAEAEKYLAGIKGEDVDLDVTSTNVDNATKALKKFLKGGNDELVDDLTGGTNLTSTALENLITSNAVKNASSAASSVAGVTAPTLSSITASTNVLEDDNFKAVYQESYLKDLDAAIKAVLGLTSTVKYADFVKVTRQVLDTLTEEADAWKPLDSDAPVLNALIEQAEAVMKADKDDDISGQYVMFGDDDAETTLKTKAGSYKGYFDLDTSSVYKFAVNSASPASGATYCKVKAAIKDLTNLLEPVPSTPTLKVVGYTTTGGASITMNLTVKAYDGEGNTSGDCKSDGREYGVTWNVTKKGDSKSSWFVNKSAAGEDVFDEKNIVPLTDTKFGNPSAPTWTKSAAEGVWKLTGTVSSVGLSSTLAKGDKVEVRFYYKTSGTHSTWEEITGLRTTIVIDGATVTPPLAAPTGITLDSPAYTPATSTPINTPNPGELINGGGYSSSGIPVGETDGKVEVTVTSSDLKLGSYDYQAVVVQNGVYIVAQDVKATGKIQFEIDDDLSVGDVTIYLQWVKKGGAKDAGAWNKGVWKFVKDTDGKDLAAKVTINPMTKWTNAAAVNAIVKEAESLQKSDYELDASAKDKVKTIDEAFSLISKDIGLVKAFMSDSKPSTAKNHNDLGGSKKPLDELITVCKYLKKLPVDLTEFNKLLDEAEKILKTDFTDIEDGTGIYTYKSLGELNKYVIAYRDTTSTKVDSSSLKSEVDQAIADLKKALGGLVRLDGVDKSDLEALIADAKALKEEDYTEESWATVKPEIDEALAAAEKVFKDEKATADEVKAAYAKLNAALAKLVEKNPAVDPSDVPEKPTYGDHWAKGKSGNWYYLVDGKAVKDTWVMSTRGIWYYMDKNGIMVTGVHNCVSTKGHYDEKTGKYNEKTTWPAGLYYFEQEGSAVPGRVFGGKWVKDANYGDVWAHGQHDGYYGKVEWTKKTGPVSNWKN